MEVVYEMKSLPSIVPADVPEKVSPPIGLPINIDMECKQKAVRLII
jgi:hypothetical protein